MPPSLPREKRKRRLGKQSPTLLWIIGKSEAVQAGHLADSGLFTQRLFTQRMKLPDYLPAGYIQDLADLAITTLPFQPPDALSPPRPVLVGQRCYAKSHVSFLDIDHLKVVLAGIGGGNKCSLSYLVRNEPPG